MSFLNNFLAQQWQEGEKNMNKVNVQWGGAEELDFKKNTDKFFGLTFNFFTTFGALFSTFPE